jgi:hypothetical protein
MAVQRSDQSMIVECTRRDLEQKQLHPPNQELAPEQVEPALREEGRGGGRGRGVRGRGRGRGRGGRGGRGRGQGRVRGRGLGNVAVGGAPASGPDDDIEAQRGRRRGRARGRRRGSVLGQGRGGAMEANAPQLPAAAAAAAAAAVAAVEVEEEEEEEEEDGHYKGYMALSPFKGLPYYNCSNSIAIDGMHAISNIIVLVMQLVSGKQKKSFEAKSIVLASRLDEASRAELKASLEARKASQVAMLTKWLLKDDCLKAIADLYNNIKGPEDFTESGRGPFHNAKQNLVLGLSFDLSLSLL